MRRRGWSTRSCLWSVCLVALGLKVATGTWSNWRRAGVEYHRGLAARCGDMSARRERWAAEKEIEASETAFVDPAAAAEDLNWAILLDADSRSYALLAASLAAKAEACEQSRVGWAFLLYETMRNPPDLPVRHSSGAGRGRPWVEEGTLPYYFLVTLYYLLVTLSHVDFPGLACLTAALVLRWSLFPPGGAASPTRSPDRAVSSGHRGPVETRGDRP